MPKNVATRREFLKGAGATIVTGATVVSGVVKLETPPSEIAKRMSRDIATDWRLALDPVAFAVERLGFTPDPWQAAVLRSSSKRLLLNCSRQSGKSTTIAVKALHQFIYKANDLVLLISPSMRQSGELFRKVLDFLHHLDHAPVLVENNKLSIQKESGARIVSLPSSEETIRGFSGVNLMIEDEASRVDDLVYVAVRPMLATSGGELVMMSTPYGKRGHFYEAWTGECMTHQRANCKECGLEEVNPWERIGIKATQCPRISKAFLAEERRALGEHFFEQEYMCEFRDTIDQIIPSELIEKAVGKTAGALDW